MRAEDSTDLLRIRPVHGWRGLELSELWKYRELLYFFTWRDLKVRYKQTLLGAAWALLQPFLTMLVFTIFFGRLAGIKSDGVPYPLWNYCGLLPWTYFCYALTQSSLSLVSNRQMIKKVYFPRLMIPMSSAMAGLVDFAIAMGLLLGMMIWYGVFPHAQVVALPLLLGLMVILALGVGLWLSALNLEYRDIQYVVPFITQFWMFLSPLAYPSSLVPHTKTWLGIEWPVRTLYGLNPMAGVIEGFRWCLLGQGTPPGGMFWVSVAMTICLFVSGLFYFRRMEKNFADVA